MMLEKIRLYSRTYEVIGYGLDKKNKATVKDKIQLRNMENGNVITTSYPLVVFDSSKVDIFPSHLKLEDHVKTYK